TNASALILCDFGESHFDNELDIVYSRHLRVKIFTSKGFSWGTQNITLYTEKHAERISDIEGVTYWLDEKGNTQKQELKSKDIFEEDVDGERTKYSFTLPLLKPGCVIELRYKIKSESLFLMRSWTFQHSEPVRWSEYRIRTPKCIGYSFVTRGFENFAIDDMEETNQLFSGQALSLLGQQLCPCNQHRWAVKDVPAIREEPFITTTDDYVNQVDVQLSGYVFSGIGRKQVLNDWETLVKELLDNKYFCDRIDDTRLVTRTAKEITQNLTSPEDKLKAIYDWVAKSIVCKEGDRAFADQEVNDVLESKKGSNADITFLLLSMLKSIGISGDPVILSTRSNGKIQDLYPIVSQFNYVLARVNLGGKFFYLDATDPSRPMDMLPFKVLNVRALVVKESPYEWVNLTCDKKYADNSVTNFNLNEDGYIKGTIEELYSDFAALKIRKKLKDSKEMDIAKELLETEKSGISIDSLTVFGKDSSNSSVKIKAIISASNYAQRNGDLIYLNPQLINRLHENPLQSKTRKYPLDFSYRSSYRSFFNITIPDSFEIKETLQPFSISAAAGALTYSRQIQIENNHITVLCKYDVNNIEVKALYYDQLQEFYSRVVASNAEQLVLERKKPILEVIKPALKPMVDTEQKSPKAETKNIKGKRK
ncbi:MAG: transglutaminase domain-containing protein, partial [Bacteroidota bacterium]|nr:transglutaminase domain-containing protein [Bacteroidota bacterium]